MTLTRTPIAYVDPIQAFAPLKDEPFALLLHGRGSRWSYICADPLERLTWRDEDGDPLRVMQERLAQLSFERPADAPPFCGGWAGLLSYEFGRAILPRLEEGAPPRGRWPDLAFGLYDEIAVYDHHTRTAEILTWKWGRKGAPGGLARVLKGGAQASSNAGGMAWSGPLAEPLPSPREAPDIYAAKIARVVDYVHAGDCFQSNISQAFDFHLAQGAHPFHLNVVLDQRSAAPFSAFFRLEGLALASNSPERFLRVRKNADGALEVSTKPIKGTRPRGRTQEEDARLARELEASEKDRAENLMIVDLMRNDLSRVCDPGSVRVPGLNALESYANVHHLVSTVTGRLSVGMGPLDLVRAAFPGGSITGAPKIRAMQIISEQEGEARGPYCGSLMWITPDGWMDSSILIRSTAFEDTAGGWRGEFRVGGGIVADSVPTEEYQETLDKASAMNGALTGAHDGRANQRELT